MFSLKPLDHFDIRNEKAGLTEPSGIALTSDGKALLVVDDGSGHVFKLGLDGKLIKAFAIDAGDLEGITVAVDGEPVYAVGEKGHQVLEINLAESHISVRKLLEDMDGYGPIRALIEDGDPKKGLEGIAWCCHSGTFFCVREARPCLLIEISADLGAVVGHRILDKRNGFSEMHNDDIDFSGICYDPEREAFWIVSHKARRVFLYSLRKNRVLDSARLTFDDNGKTKSVKQVEGVAVDAANNRLYTVCDDACELYIHTIVDT